MTSSTGKILYASLLVYNQVVESKLNDHRQGVVSIYMYPICHYSLSLYMQLDFEQKNSKTIYLSRCLYGLSLQCLSTVINGFHLTTPLGRITFTLQIGG